jgi:hypothetical protein
LTTPAIRFAGVIAGVTGYQKSGILDKICSSSLVEIHENMDKKVLVFPGAFQYVKNYGGYDGIDIWVRGESEKKIVGRPAVVVAHSMGANFALAAPDFSGCKFILVNPLVKKRSFVNLLIQDIQYLLSQKVTMEKIVPFRNWWYAFKKAYRLSKVDTLACIRKMPRGSVIVLRGRKDIFFCDKESAEIIKKEGVSLVEVDAGHDWNRNIADLVKRSLKRF